MRPFIERIFLLLNLRRFFGWGVNSNLFYFSPISRKYFRCPCLLFHVKIVVDNLYKYRQDKRL